MTAILTKFPITVFGESLYRCGKDLWKCTELESKEASPRNDTFLWSYNSTIWLGSQIRYIVDIRTAKYCDVHPHKGLISGHKLGG